MQKMDENNVVDNLVPLHPLKTAVLFLLFNRFDTTKEVFKAIKKAKPKRLYIAGDGARVDIDGEDKKVKVVREYVISNIDWDCEVKTLFRNQNLGCGLSVKNSIDWFFSMEEQGIILEDDIVPTQSFFYFCDELLNKYKSDNRIGMISGVNHIGYIPKQHSYLFSNYKGCWGWATWKRAWNNMDFSMNWLKTINQDDIIKNMSYSKISEQHWKNAIENILNNRVSAWDWQWYFSLSAQNQLCIFPKYNLTSNIGFNNDATHTFGEAKTEYVITKDLTFPLTHPSYIVPSYEYEMMFELKEIKLVGWKRFIPKKIKELIKRLL